MRRLSGGCCAPRLLSGSRQFDSVNPLPSPTILTRRTWTTSSTRMNRKMGGRDRVSQLAPNARSRAPAQARSRAQNIALLVECAINPADSALGQMSINWIRRWAAEASSSMSDRSEVTTAPPRRSAVSATVASTGPTVSGSVRRSAPARLAGSRESASTSQPSRRRARFGCRPPRQASTTQPAGTTGSTPRCMARACSAQMRRSFASAAIRAPVS